MKGRHRIVIENSRIRYDFEVRRNLTIVRGDSATGKTTLVDMVGEFYNNGDVSGVRYVCDKPCAVLSGKEWENALKVIKDSIVFIDEDNKKTEGTFLQYSKSKLPQAYKQTKILDMVRKYLPVELRGRKND